MECRGARCERKGHVQSCANQVGDVLCGAASCVLIRSCEVEGRAGYIVKGDTIEEAERVRGEADIVREEAERESTKCHGRGRLHTGLGVQVLIFVVVIIVIIAVI